MRRALFRWLTRYIHVLLTSCVVTLCLYVVVMHRVSMSNNTRSDVSADLYTLKGSGWERSQGDVNVSTTHRTINVSSLPAGTITAALTGRATSLLLAGTPRPYKGYLTIGVPTLKRPKGEYFFNTMTSLLQQSTPSQQQNVTIVVMLADRDPDNNYHTLNRIKKEYRQELGQGVVLVVSAPNTDHVFESPSIKRTFNDSVLRVRWRSKQNLDYAALMEVSANLSTYYLQIEDDVSAAPNYIQHIQKFVQDNQHRSWAGLEVSSRGFIGKLFRSADLGKLVSILRTFYLEMPCDFLIHHFYSLMLQPKVIRRKGNLFFHQGKYSSLVNVTRSIDRSNMVREITAVAKNRGDHHNPPATLHTSMSVYKNHAIDFAYDLQTSRFFWAKDVREGDDVTVVFKTPQHLTKIIVETGIKDNKGKERDLIQNGTVEFGTAVYMGAQGSRALCTDTRELGSFVNGRFQQGLDTASDVKCFTIVITQAQKEWVVIREIAVFVKK